MNKEDVIAMRTTGAGLSRQGEYWTEKEQEKLREFFNSGIGITDIAIQLHRAETAIVQQLVSKKAFENERPRRLRIAESCSCARCAKKEVCPFSLQNRGRLCFKAVEPDV